MNHCVNMLLACGGAVNVVVPLREPDESRLQNRDPSISIKAAAHYDASNFSRVHARSLPCVCNPQAPAPPGAFFLAIVIRTENARVAL